MVNQFQGLQTVKPDMELTSEMFGIRAVPADDRPIDREPGKIEIRLQVGMDLSGRQIEVGCLSPTELFKVMNQPEKRI